jgi:hypothetical protein
MPAFGQEKFVCVYFSGFGKQNAALTRDKCLTTFHAHEQRNQWRNSFESRLAQPWAQISWGGGGGGGGGGGAAEQG